MKWLYYPFIFLSFSPFPSSFISLKFWLCINLSTPFPEKSWLFIFLEWLCEKIFQHFTIKIYAFSSSNFSLDFSILCQNFLSLKNNSKHHFFPLLLSLHVAVIVGLMWCWNEKRKKKGRIFRKQRKMFGKWERWRKKKKERKV